MNASKKNQINSSNPSPPQERMEKKEIMAALCFSMLEAKSAERFSVYVINMYVQMFQNLCQNTFTA